MTGTHCGGVLEPSQIHAERPPMFTSLNIDPVLYPDASTFGVETKFQPGLSVIRSYGTGVGVGVGVVVGTPLTTM